MPIQSVQHIKRKERKSAKDLTDLISKKAYGAKVVYNYSNAQNIPPIGWYAYFSTKPCVFIGQNWVMAHDYINRMPTDSILKRYIPNFMLTGFTLKGDAS